MSSYKLKINGFKNILAGKLISFDTIELKDTRIKLNRYLVDDKMVYLFGDSFQVIGYTENSDYAIELYKQSAGKTYLEFWAICGRK
jgi:hypothetical protein